MAPSLRDKPELSRSEPLLSQKQIPSAGGALEDARTMPTF